MFVLLGCMSAPLVPTRDLSADPVIAAMPRRAWLVGVADLVTLRASGAGREVWEALPPEFSVEATRWTGAETGPDRVGLGCGDRGCVVLAEGDFQRWTPELLVSPKLRPRGDGADLRTPAGPMVLRRLSPDRMVGGDRAAVVALAQDQALEHDFEPGSLQNFVPEGALWLAATSSEGVLALLRRAGGPDLAPMLPEKLPIQLAVSLDLDPDGGARVVARARSNPGEVRTIRAQAEALAARAALEPGVVSEVHGAGDDVEVELRIEPSALSDALDRAWTGSGAPR